jgi:hypothetical protein
MAQNIQTVLENFGARLYNLMINRGYTLAAMARSTQTHPRSFRRIIDAEVAAPAKVLDKIVEIFNDKSLRTMATRIKNEYGEKGSASHPMGTNSKFHLKGTEQTKVLATLTVPFDINEIAQTFGIAPMDLTYAISDQVKLGNQYKYVVQEKGNTRTLVTQ